jgi:demethylmenaquinone methyltransferase/2-methoxy-6-polyprenyl-1,4-benzoquinol methylase
LKPLNEDLDKKKKIIEKYNSTSNFYDDRYRQIQNEKFRLQLKDTNLKYYTLLDAGCGTGLLFEYISNLFCNDINRELRYIGLDISWKMLIQFYNKTKRTTYKGNCSLILGDIDNLPFREGKFNLLISNTALQNLQDLRKGLQELIRVGKNNTTFMVSILRKQLKLEEVITYLNSHMIDLKTEIVDEIEDIIIQGTLLKD